MVISKSQIAELRKKDLDSFDGYEVEHLLDTLEALWKVAEAATPPIKIKNLMEALAALYGKE